MSSKQLQPAKPHSDLGIASDHEADSPPRRLAMCLSTSSRMEGCLGARQAPRCNLHLNLCFGPHTREVLAAKALCLPCRVILYRRLFRSFAAVCWVLQRKVSRPLTFRRRRCKTKHLLCAKGTSRQFNLTMLVARLFVTCLFGPGPLLEHARDVIRRMD